MKKITKNQKGISHVLLPLVIVVLLAIGFVGYRVFTKDNGPSKEDLAKLDGGGNLDEWPNQCSGRDMVKMTHAPMDLDDVSIIHPVGLMASAHVTPIDHLYFYSKGQTQRDANPVYAMADGFIVSDQLQERGQKLDNGKVATGAISIVVQYNCRYFSYYDLMTSLSPDIAKKLEAGDKHIPIKAGQEIGRVGAQSVDVAIYDLDLKLPGFVNPNTYRSEPWKVHTDDFFKYFSGTLRDQMLALNPRKIEPYGGKIDYDVAGKLQGNWFEVGTNGYGGPQNLKRDSVISDSGYFSGHLAISPDAVTPSKIDISFGSYEGKPQQFVALGTTPEPATVGPENGIVKYELTPYKQPTLLPMAQDTTVKGTVLFQLTDGGKKLKMEAFPGKTASQVSAFTDAAKTYER